MLNNQTTGLQEGGMLFFENRKNEDTLESIYYTMPRGNRIITGNVTATICKNRQHAKMRLQSGR